jgi:hypothetical protein
MLRQITDLGFTVSVFCFPPWLWRRRLGAVEMHVIDLRQIRRANMWRVVEGGRLGLPMRLSAVGNCAD